MLCVEVQKYGTLLGFHNTYAKTNASTNMIRISEGGWEGGAPTESLVAIQRRRTSETASSELRLAKGPFSACTKKRTADRVYGGLKKNRPDITTLLNIRNIPPFLYVGITIIPCQVYTQQEGKTDRQKDACWLTCQSTTPEGWPP